MNHFDDPIWLLSFSPLIHLPVVQKLAARLGLGRVCAEGRALRAVLRRALRDVAEALDGHPVGSLAAGLLAGRTQADVARGLGMTDEYLCRRYKPVLIDLVGQRIEMMSDGADESAGAGPVRSTFRDPAGGRGTAIPARKLAA